MGRAGHVLGGPRAAPAPGARLLQPARAGRRVPARAQVQHGHAAAARQVTVPSDCD